MHCNGNTQVFLELARYSSSKQVSLCNIVWQKNAYGALQVWTQATTYLQLIGILIGQLVFGVMGDWIGRKATMLIDISVILLGIILLTASNGPTINVSSFLDSSSSSCCSSASVYLKRLQKAQGSVFVLNNSCSCLL